MNEISAGDKQFVISIISLFVNEAPQVLKNCSVALIHEQWDELHYLVHKFAPNLSFIGINDIKTEMDKLEKNAKRKTNVQEASWLMSVITARCEAAINGLKQDFNL